MNPNRRRYETLDGLRGVAALTVMVGHFGLLLGLYNEINGFLAVDIFFIMSGFVIAHSYGERLRRGMSPWTYMYRRAVRLYPMFIIGLLLGCGVLYYGLCCGDIDYRSVDILRGAALNALFIPFPNNLTIYHETGQIFPALPPAWSLFFEMVASCAFLLLFGLGRRGLMVAVALFYAAVIAAGIYYGHDWAWIEVHNGYYTSNFWGGLPRVGFGFSLGVLLQELARDDIAGVRVRTLMRRLRYPSYLLYAAALAIFLVPRAAHGLYAVVVLATFAPALVYAGAQIYLPSGLERNVANFLGRISYPVYCLHYPVVRFVLFMHNKGYAPAHLLAVAGIFVSILLSIVLTRYYDEPVRAFLGRRKAAQPPPRANSANNS